MPAAGGRIPILRARDVGLTLVRALGWEGPAGRDEGAKGAMGLSGAGVERSRRTGAYRRHPEMRSPIQPIGLPGAIFGQAARPSSASHDESIGVSLDLPSLTHLPLKALPHRHRTRRLSPLSSLSLLIVLCSWPRGEAHLRFPDNW